MDHRHMWTELQTSVDVWECMSQNVAIGQTSHKRTGFGPAQRQKEWLPNWMQVIFVSLVPHMSWKWWCAQVQCKFCNTLYHLSTKKIKRLVVDTAVISSRRQCRTLHQQNDKSMFYTWFNKVGSTDILFYGVI